MLTLEAVADAVPQNLKNNVTQSLVDKLNNLSVDSDPDGSLADSIRQNFISYTSVLQEGKFKLTDYLNAVKFVSFCMMNMTKQDAWKKTFPDRYQELVAKGTTKKDMSSHVSMYSKGQLVNLVMEQSLVPFWVLNQGMRQKALEAQYRLMLGASSELVRTQAANSILTHLTPPAPVKNAQVNISFGASDSLKALEASMQQLAAKQKTLIASGVLTTKAIADSSIVDAVVEPV